MKSQEDPDNNTESNDRDPKPASPSCSSETPPNHNESSPGLQPACQFAVELPNIPAPSKPLNPADLDKWRVDITIPPATEEKQIVANLTKPHKTDWFRTWGDRKDWIGCYIYKKSGGTLFVVVPEIAAKMADCVQLAILVPWSNTDGKISFWAFSLPDPIQPNGWHTSALAIAESARSAWQKMLADKKGGFYLSAVAENPRPDPEWPEQEVMEHLRGTAVSPVLIDSETHPAFLDYLMR